MKATRIPVYAYARVSSQQQVGGSGLQRQGDLVAGWLERHQETHELVRAFDDAGLSGWKGTNLEEGAGLAEFLSMLAAGKVKAGSVLLVEQVDRLSRRGLMQSIPLVMQIVGAGVTIHSLLDSRTLQGGNVMAIGDLITLAVNLDQGHIESQKKSERIRAAWEKKIAKAEAEGVAFGKQCPSWCVMDGKVYKLDAERAAVVKRIYAMRLAGHSCTGIAEALNQDGVSILTRRKDVNPNWQNETVRDLLKQVAVTGAYRSNPSLYPAVVSMEDFQAVQRMRTKGRGATMNADRPAAASLLKGLMACEECGRSLSLSGVSASSRGKYRCRCKGLVPLPALEMEARLVGQCLGVIEIPEAAGEALEQAKKEEARLSKAIKRSGETLMDVDDEEAESIQANIKKASAELKAIRSQIQAMEMERPAIGELGQMDLAGDYSDRVRGNSLLKQHVKRIVVSHQRQEAVIMLVTGGVMTVKLDVEGRDKFTDRMWSKMMVDGDWAKVFGEVPLVIGE
ncbi:recombinase family protein [Aeromonas caviae]|uniref:recombinase family protein n=1 Tax=Aeromonas caviae TaxID=648 RepID=UPI002B482480|nr:recombinase family protein [Aeromonas caviae]